MQEASPATAPYLTMKLLASLTYSSIFDCLAHSLLAALAIALALSCCPGYCLAALARAKALVTRSPIVSLPRSSVAYLVSLLGALALARPTADSQMTSVVPS